MEKKVAIHQPNYLPWPGYFYKLWLSDSFVFLNHVKLNKQGLTRRTFIPKLSALNEKTYLTVPLIKHPDNSIIKDLKIDHSKDWSTQHFDKLKQLYYRAHATSPLWDHLAYWYKTSSQFEYLAEWNEYLIKELILYLGFDRNTVNSSTLQIAGVKDEMHTEILSKIGGSVYISGASGTVYRQDSSFANSGIKVVDTDFLSFMKKHPYKTTDFQPGLNILDMIFTLGKAGTISYFENYNEVKPKLC
ncbi:MAG TPA: WbqC family protein [Saprospiraceae bacterium]|nr:WbqC family protein [Saprospiraceae bacterium]